MNKVKLRYIFGELPNKLVIPYTIDPQPSPPICKSGPGDQGVWIGVIAVSTTFLMYMRLFRFKPGLGG